MEEVTEHEDYPGKCYVNATGRTYEVDDLWYSNTSCRRMSCTKYVAPSGEDQLLVITSTCPSVSAEAPCYLVEDKGRRYPDCCPRYECPPLEAMSLFDGINVLDNEISTDAHTDNQVDHLHMMESQHAPVVVRVPPAAAESVMEGSVDYDLTLPESANEAEVSDLIFSSTPFRSQFFRYGKPIHGFRRRR